MPPGGVGNELRITNQVRACEFNEEINICRDGTELCECANITLAGNAMLYLARLKCGSEVACTDFTGQRWDSCNLRTIV